MTQTVRVDQLVDDQKVGWFNLDLLFWSFLAMLADGYDLGALSYAQPELQALWHLPKTAFGLASSASLVGILLGAPLFGLLGDRIGRRRAIVAGSIVYGLFTLGTVWTQTLPQIEAMRFATGLGLGGIMPNTIALNSELAPRRRRATLVTLMFIGVSVGSGLPGAVAYGLMPRYGWTVLFTIGGIGSLVLAAALALRLPESVKFLALHPRRRSELLRNLQRMRPEIEFSDDVCLIAEPDATAAAAESSELRQIFRGDLGRITALLWICFASALMALFFLNSFLPLIFSSTLGRQQVALLATLFPIGGAMGGLLVSALVDRLGLIVVAALFALAMPAIASLGVVRPDFLTYAPLVILAGLAVHGAQHGNNAAAGLLYPTGVRSKGVGLALGIGRTGAIVGPLIGARLLELPLRWIFFAAAVPVLVGTCAACLLMRLCYTRLGGCRLREMPVQSDGAKLGMVRFDECASDLHFVGAREACTRK